MAKKKQKKRNTSRPAGARPSGVTLSQCMIVKNEEKNIEQALSWGRGIVCEQIVVDTGSADRTVELAERMGAKVFHFEWINDFAAAKNYAIGQAGGSWIAFLDADEYFEPDDAARILPILSQIDANPDMRKKCLGVSCPMHQLDDDGKISGVFTTSRLFRNIPRVRYFGRIHEQVNIDDTDTIRTEDIKIMHTGYSESAYTTTGKSERNIGMLRAELEGNLDETDRLRMKLYLANALMSHSNTKLCNAKEKEELRAESETLYREVARSSIPVSDEYKKTAYGYLLGECAVNAELIPEHEDIIQNAIRDFPDDHKIQVYYAGILNKKGRHREAFDMLQKLEARQGSPATRSFGYSTPDMLIMCKQLVYAAEGLGDIDSIFKYTAAILMVEKRSSGILGIYLKIILRLVPNIEGALELVGMMYDLSNADEAAFVAEAARQQGAAELAERIIATGTKQN